MIDGVVYGAWKVFRGFNTLGFCFDVTVAKNKHNMK